MVVVKKRVLQSAHNRRFSGDDRFGHVVADLLTLAIREWTSEIGRFAYFLTSGSAGEHAQRLVLRRQWIIQNLHFFHDPTQLL